MDDKPSNEILKQINHFRESPKSYLDKTGFTKNKKKLKNFKNS